MSSSEPVYDSIVGLWVQYLPLSEYGSIATVEILFEENGGFLWREMRGERRDELRFTNIKGRWRLEDEILQLDFTATEEPDMVPRKRHILRIFDRRGRLGMQTIRLDDQPEMTGRWDGAMYFLQPAQPGEAERSHQVALEKMYKPIPLERPFRLLHPLLAAAIAPAVRRLKLQDPIFCIRLYYHNTCAPGEEYCTWVRVLTEPLRQKVLAEQRPLDVEYYLWHPTAGEANGLPGRDVGLYEADLTGSREIMRLYADVYELLCQDEEEYMRQLQEMLRLVSQALNKRDWTSISETTDDFVVFPADGSNHYAGEYEGDMETSIPAEKLDLLRQRGLLARG